MTMTNRVGLIGTVVPKVFPFIDEPVPIGVDHDSERVAGLRELITQHAVADVHRGIGVPASAMTPSPIALEHITGTLSHQQSFSGVVGGSSDLRSLSDPINTASQVKLTHPGIYPFKPEVFGPHLTVRLKPA